MWNASSAPKACSVHPLLTYTQTQTTGVWYFLAMQIHKLQLNLQTTSFITCSPHLIISALCPRSISRYYKHRPTAVGLLNGGRRLQLTKINNSALQWRPLLILVPSGNVLWEEKKCLFVFTLHSHADYKKLETVHSFRVGFGRPPFHK